MISSDTKTRFGGFVDAFLFQFDRLCFDIVELQGAY